MEIQGLRHLHATAGKGAAQRLFGQGTSGDRLENMGAIEGHGRGGEPQFAGILAYGISHAAGAKGSGNPPGRGAAQRLPAGGGYPLSRGQQGTVQIQSDQPNHGRFLRRRMVTACTGHSSWQQ